jgi:hypothetical protein
MRRDGSQATRDAQWSNDAVESSSVGEVNAMATNGTVRIEKVYQLARALKDQLEPLARQHDGSMHDLHLRLAMAHALGVLDQLNEILAPTELVEGARFGNSQHSVMSRDEEPLGVL